jgi:predicted GIY-YIG superfamily endonuclease
MAKRRRSSSRYRFFWPKIDRNAVRDWSLYVTKLNDGKYYVGITSYKDIERRIAQHGGRNGAKFTRGKRVVSIIETRHLGKMPRRKAEDIENQVFLQYRKQYGYHNVRGGYNAFLKPSLTPNYTPGSKESIIFILTCLIAAIVLVWIMAVFG